MTQPTAHVQAIEKRETCRAQLLELRRTRAQKESQLGTLTTEIAAMQRLEVRTRAQLIELTTDVKKLLDADSTGVIGARLPATEVESSSSSPSPSSSS